MASGSGRANAMNAPIFFQIAHDRFAGHDSAIFTPVFRRARERENGEPALRL
ncbi:hypothetical protein C7S17_3107 [Burkholderia thailandensis]|nr:hypothetical protein [Burkholderia thailandensis]